MRPKQNDIEQAVYPLMYVSCQIILIRDPYFFGDWNAQWNYVLTILR